MPELPEVTTTVNGLSKTITRLTFSDVWTDLAKDNPIKQFHNTLKDKKFLSKFKKEIIGQKVIKVGRRAKNILIYLSNKKVILIHLKMTGHLLYGKYIKVDNKWIPDEKERNSLKDPYNRFIHVVFTFSNGKNLVMSDSRKFGKITLLDENDFKKNDYLFNKLGPEPLDKKFTFKDFIDRLMLKHKGKIKTVLMNQNIISGIGNIYSDEMLWLSNIHPESKPSKIPIKYLQNLYISMREILRKGINFGGDSMSDYRDINGERGNFQDHHNVYKKKNTKCIKKGCHGVIIRKVINGRSAHFCSIHQKLFN